PTWLLRAGDGPGLLPPGACGQAQAMSAGAPAAGDSWDRYRPPPLRDCFSLTATKAAEGGVEPASQFVLTSATREDADALAERLKVSPPVAFRVVQLGEGDAGARFRIEPAALLAPDTLYRFALLDEPGGRVLDEWTFQSQGALRVVQTLPADRSTAVPVDAAIELTFSHDGVTGVQERFRITPAVEGRWETHKRTAVFVPKALATGTLYTVTLEAGASVPGTGGSIAEDMVFRFETGADQRGGSPLAMRFGRAFWESATAEPPVLGMFWTGYTGGSPPQDRPVSFSVYRFGGAGEFTSSFGRLTAVPSWAVFTRETLLAPTEGLERVAAFTVVPARGGTRGDLFVRLPSALPAGWYLVEADVEGRRAQAWLQSTDVAAYAAVSGTKTVVWVNDLAARRPIPGATVAAVGTDFSTKTGDDGLALFDTPRALLQLQPAALGVEAESVRNLMVTAGGRSAVVPLADLLAGAPSFEYREFPFEGDPGLYWRFLYTDRQLFRMTDAINFWGLVRHREDAASGTEVRLELRGGDGTGLPDVVASTTSTTGSTGTFIGRLAFAGVSPGFYQFEARVGDQVVASRYVEVEDFTSPAYSVDVVPSAPAAYAGDEVSFAIRATFFDGSPVPGVRLRVHGKA
ncbi:MAG: Ig-like domain-containing protein, partial [Actinomycetota bacterium]